jgi:predicted porin
MKKTLLAAAMFTTFAGVAQAESSVTLYGVIDTGIGYNKIEGDGYDGSKLGMINGIQAGSRWGVRGSEDLGDGLRAVFKLESGFDSANGQRGQSGRLFGRQATIGLANDAWGTLDFGRQATIGSPTSTPSTPATRNPTWAWASARPTPCAGTTWSCTARPR